MRSLLGFTHVTVVPTGTLTFAGENELPLYVMVTGEGVFPSGGGFVSVVVGVESVAVAVSLGPVPSLLMEYAKKPSARMIMTTITIHTDLVFICSDLGIN